MISKTIKYCWFGGGKKPKGVVKCIESWKKFCPEFKIKEWNESNFDLQCCDYVREAAEAKKWAFVSDYARFWILYNYGGLYFDTDVELINSIDEILYAGPFMGREASGDIAPGLGLAADKGMGLYKKVINYYESQHFLSNNGTENVKTIVTIVTNILIESGFKKRKKGLQKIDGINIYPEDYFCPLNYETGELKISKNSVAIHHYEASWHSNLEKLIHRLSQINNRENNLAILLLIVFLRIINKVRNDGFRKVIVIVIRRFKLQVKHQ